MGPGSRDKTQAAPTACSACRWIGRSRSKATGLWWRASRSPVLPMPAMRWSCCRIIFPGGSGGSRSTAKPAIQLWPANAPRLTWGHWDHRAIRRGDVLTLPGYFAPQEWFVCSLRLLPRDKLFLKSGAEVKFHTGTSDVAAMFYPLKGSHMEGGMEGLIQVRTKTPLVAGPGDFFIIRTPSPVRTVGGGRIVEAVDRRLKARHPGVYEDLQQRAEAAPDERRFVEYCVHRAEVLAVAEQDVAARAKVPRGRLQEILADLAGQDTIKSLPGGLFIHKDTIAEVENRLVDMIGDYHNQSSSSPGIAIDDLRQSAAIDKTVFDSLIIRLKNAERIVELNQRLALPGHRSTFRDEDAKLLDAIEAVFRDQAFHPPGIDEIAQKTGAAQVKVEKIIKILREHGRLVEVEKGLLFHAETVDRARQMLIGHLQKEGRLESVQFKYLLDTTRKFALPMLDYLDRQGLTRRVGNTRFPKP